MGDDRAGTFFECPKCAGPIVVPEALPSSHPPPKLIDYTPDKPIEEEPPTRLHKKSSPWLPLIVVSGIFVSFLFGVIFGRLTSSKKAETLTNSSTVGPTAPSVWTGRVLDDSWTHKELIAYLDSKGLKYRRYNGTWGTFWGPAVFLVVKDSDVPDDGSSVAHLFLHDPNVIYCQLRKSEQDARDEAGIHLDKAYSAGRFLFRGHPAELDKIKAALR